MKVGLIDVDRTDFPNLVLMKLSSWYKAKGHETVLLHPADVINGQNLFGECDEMIGACVFDWNRHTCDLLEKCGVNIGGGGEQIQGESVNRGTRTFLPGLFTLRNNRKKFRFFDKRLPKTLPILCGR